MVKYKSVPQIAPAELVVIRALWRRSPATASQIVAELQGEVDWKPKTIHTLLKRLVAKGAISQEKQGREYIFQPVMEQEEHAIHASRSFLERFFNGELTPFLSTFLKHEKLSKREVAEIERLLKEFK
jgi:BlaI family penicillinase repressor